MTVSERTLHEEWLGMVQPSQGLVVSAVVLERAQCLQRLPKDVHQRLRDLCVASEGAKGAAKNKRLTTLTSLPAVLEQLLDLTPDLFDTGDRLPSQLSLYVPEGRQTLRPTMALRRRGVAPNLRASRPPASSPSTSGLDHTPASAAGERYAMLVWETPTGLDLDKPETQTGPWEYPAQAKFDRLLRECRVPIGLLCNGTELRLVYAPPQGATGWIAFRVADMCESDGRLILDAFMMLLGAHRWFAVSPEHQLPALLRDSRECQNEVTNALAKQVFEALEILLSGDREGGGAGGFQGAAERDQDGRLEKTLEADPDLVYSGLLTVLLRLVFLLYCEDHRLLPTEHSLFGQHYSVLALFEQLTDDNDRYHDSMGLRFGAYSRLVSLFRLVWLGGRHQDLDLPERRGELFDPNEFPFLEGWGPGGSAPLVSAEQRQAVRVPSVDDATIYQVLEKLIVLDGQRLSYRSLRIEQIGSVYEALMGFGVERLAADAVRLRPSSKKGAARIWLDGPSAAPLG